MFQSKYFNTALVQCYRHFCNVPKKRVGFLGVPFGQGQKNAKKCEGLELAPDLVRKSSLLTDFQSLGLDVKDFGDVTYTPLNANVEVAGMMNYNHVLPNLKQISARVYDIVKDNRICLTIGGDHSLFTGTIHGHLKAAGDDNVAVIYVDAHADINTNESSLSRNIHGMCVSMALREFQQHWNKCPTWDWLEHSLPVKNLGYIGLRSVDPAEARTINEFGIAAYTSSDVTKHGIASVLSNLMKRIDPENNKIIHLSIDTDSLDPLEAPSTTLGVRGGLLLRELIYIAEELSATQRIGAVDFVELNPKVGTKDDWDKTLQAAHAALMACFGNKTAGNP